MSDYHPHILLICEAYAALITERLGNSRCDWVARVLSSTELRPEPERPLALLEDVLCERLRARSLTRLFYRSETRPSMRLVGPLSGPDMLKRRIRYAAQDLFINRESAGGNALLLDDIFNTGASMRVYAQALKEFAGVKHVTGANLAATRFAAGKDGRGRLQLETSRFDQSEDTRTVWVDESAVFHEDETCPTIGAKTSYKLRFIARKAAQPCPVCAVAVRPKRRFWGLLP